MSQPNPVADRVVWREPTGKGLIREWTAASTGSLWRGILWRRRAYNSRKPVSAPPRMAPVYEGGLIGSSGAQMDALRDLGCEEGQGYLFGRPVPAEVLISGLEACNGSRSGHRLGVARPTAVSRAPR